MFAKAVICTDLTEDSDALVGCAGRLSILGVREAVLTHVVDVFSEHLPLTDETQVVEDTFQRQLSMLEGSGLSVHVEAPLGHPAFSVEEVRRRHHAELIVVGSHGKGGFSQPFSGSISSDLVQLSDSPVLVASLRQQADPDESSIACAQLLENVLVCTDLSDSTTRVLAMAQRLVRLGARSITLLHVQDVSRRQRLGWESDPEHERSDAVDLARLKKQLVRAGASEVEVEVAYGSPAVELSRRAASGRYSLVVLGSRGRSAPDNESPVDVNDSILRAARIPLMVVPTR